ncbi:DUF2463 domain-containing protein [Encephalitozoon intestinalis]|nr:DUF2463 domain-containing protein [Encephalitozoon intestinalis]
MSIPTQTPTPKHSYNLNLKQKFRWLLGLYSAFATPISILIPLLMSMAFEEDTFQDNSLLRFIFFAIPLSHLSLLNLRLFFAVKNSDEKLTSPFRSILHSILKLFFFAFFIVSILLIPTLYFLNRNSWDIKKFSSFTWPFALSTSYLLSTSCCFTPSSISFVDTEFDLLLDLFLLLSSLLFIFITWKETEESLPPYLTISSLLLILLKSLNRRYNPSPKTEEITAWRQVFLVLIFISFIIPSLMMGIGMGFLLFFSFSSKESTEFFSSK